MSPRAKSRKNIVELPFTVWQALGEAKYKKGMTSQQIMLTAIHKWLIAEGFLSEDSQLTQETSLRYARAHDLPNI